MLGGRLPETENKRICQISGLNSGRGTLRRTGKQNGCLQSGRWLITEGGRYEGVDCN